MGIRYLLKQKMRKSLTYTLRGFTKGDEEYFFQSEEAYEKVGIVVKRAKKNEQPTCIVYKSTSDKLSELYPPSVASAKLSITDRSKSPIHVHLCKENWDAIPFHLGSEYKNLDAYRVALISHEFAHVLGHDHVHCACVGCEADVRQQPSRHLHGCKPTTKIIFNKNSPHTDDNF
jgi:hypothetical protein